MAEPVRVCFVCLGNICRSPTAEGIMIHLVKEAGLESAIQIDSAGTGGWHVGERADPRTRKVAKQRGVDLPSRARQFIVEDFSRFDYIVCMDDSNLTNVLALSGATTQLESVSLLRDHDSGSPKDSAVPDPYYGGPGGFDDVFDICEAGCRGLLQVIRKQHKL